MRGKDKMKHQGPISNDEVIEMLHGLSLTLSLQSQLIESLIERLRMTNQAEAPPTLKIAKPRRKGKKTD